MHNTSKILHNAHHGDILLASLSRKDTGHYSSASLIMDGLILTTIHTSSGAQTIQRSIFEFLEHENKPIIQFRYKSSLVITELPKLTKYVNSQLKYKTWKLLGRDVFKKDNCVDMSNVLMSFLEIHDLTEIENLGKFNRLL